MSDTPDTPETPDSSDRRPDEYPQQPQNPQQWQQWPAAPRGWQPPLKPGVIPLRPLGLGDILGGAFATMRTRAALMLGVTAVVVVITQLLTFAGTFPLLVELSESVVPDPYTSPYGATYVSPGDVLRLAGLTMLVALIGLVLAMASRVFLAGFFTVVVGTAVLGQRPSFREVMRRVRPRLLPLFGLTLIYLLVLVAAGGVVGVFMAASPAFGVLVLLGMVVLAAWLGILFLLATPALVLEGVGVRRAFGRSRDLVHGAWWRIFGITLLTGLMVGFAAFVIALPFEAMGGGFAASVTPLTTNYLVLSTIGAVIASTVTEPFAAAVTALLYTDQRIRRERLDIELARTVTTS